MKFLTIFAIAFLTLHAALATPIRQSSDTTTTTDPFSQCPNTCGSLSDAIDGCGHKLWCAVKLCEESGEFRCEPCSGEVNITDSSFDGYKELSVGCLRCEIGVIGSASAPISESSFDCVKSCAEEDNDYKEKCTLSSVTSDDSFDLIDKCEAKCSTSSSARRVL